MTTNILGKILTAEPLYCGDKQIFNCLSCLKVKLYKNIRDHNIIVPISAGVKIFIPEEVIEAQIESGDINGY